MRRLVIGRGLTLTLIGVGAGLLLGSAVTAFLSVIFYGARAFDLRVLGATAGLLALVAMAASWWPARYAMRVDPMTVLKR
jgi:putative ABC transport system permease protein